MAQGQSPLMPARFSANRPLRTPSFGSVSGPPQIQQNLQNTIGSQQKKKKSSGMKQSMVQALTQNGNW